MTTARKPHTQPLHTRRDERWAWAFLAIVAAVMLIEIGLPLLDHWMGGR